MVGEQNVFPYQRPNKHPFILIPTESWFRQIALGIAADTGPAPKANVIKLRGNNIE